MNNISAAPPGTAAAAGQFLVVLAGVTGAALIVALGLGLVYRPQALAGFREGRLAAAYRAAGCARGAISRRYGPATAAVVTVLAGLVIAVAVTYGAGMLTKAGPVIRLDRPLDRFVDSHRVAFVTSLMTIGTRLGSYLVVFTIAVVGGLIIGARSHRWLPLLVLVAAVPTEIWAQRAVALLVHGAKPAPALSVGPAGTFFSGGSARSLLICGLLAYFLGWLGSGRRLRAFLWTCVALATFCEGYSRLYLGRHFTVDILGGWLFGLLALAAFAFAAGALRPAPDHEPAAAGVPVPSPRPAVTGTPTLEEGPAGRSWQA